MKHIELGDLDVSRIGLGAMGMSAAYTGAGTDDAGSIRTIHRALDLGVRFLDTAETYGPFANEELVGRAIRGHRDQVVLATKFGRISHARGGARILDSSPANIRAAAEGSLRRLGTDHIDLDYQHRVDPSTPIQDTIGALAELVAEGKVGHSPGMSMAYANISDPVVLATTGPSCSPAPSSPGRWPPPCAPGSSGRTPWTGSTPTSTRPSWSSATACACPRKADANATST